MQNEYKFKVVLINDTSTSKGGASAIAIENAKQMAIAGIQVVFISSDATLNQELINLGIECISLPGSSIDPDNPMKGLFLGLHNKRALAFLSRWIDENDTDSTIYHVHAWSKIFSPSIFQALIKVSSRLIVHGHDYFPVCPNGAFVNYKNNKGCELTPLSFKCLASNCDQRSYSHKVWRFVRGLLRSFWINFSKTNTKLVLLHESMRNFYIKGDISLDNLLVIPNPVMPYLTTRIEAEKNKHFVFIGRVVPEKGTDIFLAAASFAGVPAKVIGDGADLAKLKVAYPEAEFCGWQNHAGISEIVKNSRMLVMPSKTSETFGLVAVEAIASGLPVLVSDKSALAKDIEQLSFGKSFNVDNLDELVTLIKRFSASDEQVAEMSKHGFINWQRLALTPEGWREQLLNLYASLISKRELLSSNEKN